jgi:TetR/AcrR family transcriptional repressor of nem operon
MKTPRPAPRKLGIDRETPQRILDIASRLVQTRGFNGFSYADIAAELAVTKASLHYHFPSKAELGRHLIDRYAGAFATALEGIGAGDADEFDKLQRYTQLYATVLREHRMCLCGMLAAESATLPEPMREALKHFFEFNERWLASVLERGRRKGRLRFAGSPIDAARMLVGALEGAMMLAHSLADATRFKAAANRLLAEFAPAHTAAPPDAARNAALSAPGPSSRPRQPRPAAAR